MIRFQKLNTCSHCGSDEFFKIIKTKIDKEGNAVSRSPIMEYECSNCSAKATPVSIQETQNVVPLVPQETNNNLPESITPEVKEVVQKAMDEVATENEQRPKPIKLDLDSVTETRSRPKRLPPGF